ncbi:MAG: o-succinylbenzoate synthase [Deltaproteobacteria bacterium]|nr:MAG: o-succinylbenzoate synthase [Deltaproteobacteria bacterium]
MLKLQHKRHNLRFKRPAGTSRGILTEKPGRFVEIYCEGRCGRGEVSLIPGLSPDDEKLIESELDRIGKALRGGAVDIDRLCCPDNKKDKKSPADYKTVLADIAALLDTLEVSPDGRFPAVRFAMETALLELVALRKGDPFDSPFLRGEQKIPINGLIWMGDVSYMRRQIENKLAEGYKCLKLKIGAIDFAAEYTLLAEIRKRFSKDALELRVDANGAFSPEQAPEILQQLSKFDLHSIEQPIAPGQRENMAKLCRESPLAIALDEELIGIPLTEQNTLLEQIKPRYIILKPSLLGGFYFAEKWIEHAAEHGIGYWITSALESNLGLNAIARWTALHNVQMPQGLGTGALFVNNLPSSLRIEEGHLGLAV